MSLLGKLLSGLPSTSASTPSRPKNPLDSSLEDQFTHNLLFPDPDALCHHDQVFPLSSGAVLTPAPLTNFDINSDIEVEMRDIRVIIMQEATPTSGSAYLLYDSHTPSLDRQSSHDRAGYPAPSDGRRAISSPRKASVGQNSRPVVIQPEASAPRAFGAFDRRPTHHKSPSCTETDGQRSAREYKEEVTTFSNCIFGNSEVLAYKGTGTKVHILPSETRPTWTSSSYPHTGDVNSSFGRSSMRSSRLAQSFTSDNYHAVPTSAGFMSPNPSSRGERRKVLITRMFPVPLPKEVPDDSSRNITPLAQNVPSGDPLVPSGYPFPTVVGGRKLLQPKQKRTPMYAVGLVIQLPSSLQEASVPASRSSFRGSGSLTEPESFSSSYNSTRRAGWTMLGHGGFGVESMDSSYSSDVDDHIELITQHWDVIMRTLSHLQSVATASLWPMLKQADVSSPGPRSHSSHNRTSSASISVSGRRVEDSKPFKTPKTNAKFVQLMANCLMPIPTIHNEVDVSRQRILSGIKTSQVVTGQGRWGIWREEARLVGKWAGSKDEGFFFFNLLTGFLGNHTEWLQALGPSWYRRRHYQYQRENKDDISLPARTIVVSDNKLMARRLVFLLSAFLPANQPLTAPRHRPGTSVSFGAYSQSPPMYGVPVLREESLRRRINKRSSVARGAHSRTLSFPAQGVSSPPAPLPLSLDIHLHDRRPSDATSVRTANLPIPGSDLGTRKSSAATTSTVTPVATMPHFSTTRRPVRGTGPEPRPGSSGSLATDDLLRSLKRGESSGQYSNISVDSPNQNSRWGSMISGFWSTKRRSSTATTEIEPFSKDGSEAPASPRGGGSQPVSKLAAMVQEATLGSSEISKGQEEREARRSDGSVKTAKPDVARAEEIPEQVIHVMDRKPDPSGAFESPVKTSINEDDGVIDIDVPLPEYLSFDTAVSSPSSSGYLSTPGFGNGMEGFEHYSRSGTEMDTTMNVGGWLPRYHPDFSLQSIPPQIDLLEDVKASMREEATPLFSLTPLPDNGRLDRWVDVSSAIIADTTNFSIKRIRYRRLVKPKDPAHATTSTPTVDSRYGNVYSAAQMTPALEVYDAPVEERFIEEPIISMDETLIQAVEKIIAQSGQASSASSICSSRSTSRKGGSRERSNSDTKLPIVPGPRLEVPRNECKKMVLGALEEIVKEVAESRKDGEDVDLERTESFLREGVRNWLVNVETLE
ncbi:folliculin-interacting protein N-terminus-domain-containing protein [Amylocarpus encephaloides]|uniref:Folliculin-interacting protein N-terminus-domain-containing protein n=1 Tax=Amylocarpus encephaloides TaxID=45428 RepID=A0A9P7YK01_9HELO|nr:folliculin-interacting protein N-terminus-domain-containing protein [Amylocarpus encephaloides]